MAFKRRNEFYQNKKQETTEIVRTVVATVGEGEGEVRWLPRLGGFSGVQCCNSVFLHAPQHLHRSGARSPPYKLYWLDRIPSQSRPWGLDTIDLCGDRFTESEWLAGGRAVAELKIGGVWRHVVRCGRWREGGSIVGPVGPLAVCPSRVPSSLAFAFLLRSSRLRAIVSVAAVCAGGGGCGEMPSMAASHGGILYYVVKVPKQEACTPATVQHPDQSTNPVTSPSPVHETSRGTRSVEISTSNQFIELFSSGYKDITPPPEAQWTETSRRGWSKFVEFGQVADCQPTDRICYRIEIFSTGAHDPPVWVNPLWSYPAATTFCICSL
ncbi:hypothetical protein AAG570_004284 [Ranatra chinensis]|uniref:Uncharacterized protein n=1 Tax=Ranatra chinensis TaxID=642074 RepID=A0ABD0Y0G1_9HEMI